MTSTRHTKWWIPEWPDTKIWSPSKQMDWAKWCSPISAQEKYSGRRWSRAGKDNQLLETAAKKQPFLELSSLFASARGLIRWTPKQWRQQHQKCRGGSWTLHTHRLRCWEAKWGRRCWWKGLHWQEHRLLSFWPRRRVLSLPWLERRYIDSRHISPNWLMKEAWRRWRCWSNFLLLPSQLCSKRWWMVKKRILMPRSEDRVSLMGRWGRWRIPCRCRLSGCARKSVWAPLGDLFGISRFACSDGDCFSTRIHDSCEDEDFSKAVDAVRERPWVFPVGEANIFSSDGTGVD